jgi:hypothetical protein
VVVLTILEEDLMELSSYFLDYKIILSKKYTFLADP